MACLLVRGGALFVGHYPVDRPDLPRQIAKLATHLDVIMMILGMTPFLLPEFIQ